MGFKDTLFGPNDIESEGQITVAQFCQAVQIHAGEFYRLLSVGKGPRIMRIGQKIRIPKEAVQEWRETHETEDSRDSFQSFCKLWADY